MRWDNVEELVVGRGRQRASLLRIGLRCDAQREGSVSGGVTGEGWGGGVAAGAGLGTRLGGDACLSVRNVLPKSSNHNAMHSIVPLSQQDSHPCLPWLRWQQDQASSQRGEASRQPHGPAQAHAPAAGGKTEALSSPRAALAAAGQASRSVKDSGCSKPPPPRQSQSQSNRQTQSKIQTHYDRQRQLGVPHVRGVRLRGRGGVCTDELLPEASACGLMGPTISMSTSHVGRKNKHFRTSTAEERSASAPPRARIKCEEDGGVWEEKEYGKIKDAREPECGHVMYKGQYDYVKHHAWSIKPLPQSSHVHSKQGRKLLLYRDLEVQRQASCSPSPDGDHAKAVRMLSFRARSYPPDTSMARVRLCVFAYL